MGLCLYYIEIIANKGRPISFVVDESHFAILQVYSDIIFRSFPKIDIVSDDGSHLESLLMLSDQEDKYYQNCALTSSLPNDDKIKCHV